MHVECVSEYQFVDENITTSLTTGAGQSTLSCNTANDHSLSRLYAKSHTALRQNKAIVDIRLHPRCAIAPLTL